MNLSKRNLQRINVVGVSGSGKSTFAAKLANVLKCKHIQLDGLYHEPNWVEADIAVFRERLKTQLNVDQWIIDGNYHSKIHDLKWEKATMIIWLDLSLTRTLWQAGSRAFARAWKQEELWGTGNRESFRRSFFSRESVVLRTITSYSRVKRRYQNLQKDPKWTNIKFVRIRSHQEAEDFLKHASHLA